MARVVVLAAVATTAAGALLLLCARTGGPPVLPTPPSATPDAVEAARVEVEPGRDAAVDADPAPSDGDRREAVAAAPGLDDFAPGQRAAVREPLGLGRPGPEQVEAIHAAQARLDEDDRARRFLLGFALLGSTAIVRCDVLAVGEDAITVRYRTAAPQVAARIGQRHTLQLGATRAQREVMQAHGLAERADVVVGREQTLLVCRDQSKLVTQDLCVVAGPPRGEVADGDGSEPAQPVASIEDFPPAARAAVRDLLTGRSNRPLP